MKTNNRKFIVKDWTGKTLDYYGKSDCFEDAWSKVYENFAHLTEAEFDEQIGEFHVEEVRPQ